MRTSTRSVRCCRRASLSSALPTAASTSTCRCSRRSSDSSRHPTGRMRRRCSPRAACAKIHGRLSAASSQRRRPRTCARRCLASSRGTTSTSARARCRLRVRSRRRASRRTAPTRPAQCDAGSVRAQWHTARLWTVVRATAMAGCGRSTRCGCRWTASRRCGRLQCGARRSAEPQRKAWRPRAGCGFSPAATRAVRAAVGRRLWRRKSVCSLGSV
mmetsp:Transcript_59497/g.163206  ORF Transcript_59497/g.163206 Transcript_59497/m.163206 type:complete len:215 (+) Transcript_59497:496-1140(+)